MISGDKLFNILHISVANILRFFSWTVTDLQLERIFSNDEKWSLHTTLNALSWNSLSKLVDSMQIVTMHVNSASFEVCTSIFLPGCVFLRSIFWAIFKRWSSNVHLWSLRIPNNSSYLWLLRWSPHSPLPSLHTHTHTHK